MVEVVVVVVEGDGGTRARLQRFTNDYLSPFQPGRCVNVQRYRRYKAKGGGRGGGGGGGGESHETSQHLSETGQLTQKKKQKKTHVRPQLPYRLKWKSGETI